MEVKPSINTSLKRWMAGDFKNPSVSVQVEAGWFDWFCKDESLARKTDHLYKLALRLIEADRGRRINCDEAYIWFKNNCPLSGRLYDDFRIADMVTHNVIFTVVPSNGHYSKLGVAELWGKENDFKEALIAGSMDDIVGWFRRGP